MSNNEQKTGSWRTNKWIRAAIPALLLHCSIGTVYCWSIFSQEIADYIGFSKGSPASHDADLYEFQSRTPTGVLAAVYASALLTSSSAYACHPAGGLSCKDNSIAVKGEPIVPNFKL